MDTNEISSPVWLEGTEAMKEYSARQRYPRFKKGEVVKMTEEAVSSNLKGRGSLYGIVTSSAVRTPYNYAGITVRRIDQKGKVRFWAGFWRHLRQGEMALLPVTVIKIKDLSV